MALKFAIIFTATLIVALVAAWRVIAFARRHGIVDVPNEDRKRHAGPVPLLGGWAVYLAFAAGIMIAWPELVARGLTARHWLGFLSGGVVLQVGGYLDDRYRLRPGQQLLFPLAAIAIVLAGGIRIERLTSPFGGLLELTAAGGMIASALIIALWLLGMMYTTKLLDGVDGLVAGVTAVGAAVIALFTMTTRYYQPDIGAAALILLAAALGFLAWNWHPARIFLGEGGSLFLGYALGVLAVISGGKIAIALLVMGIPILDVAWTIIRRLRAGRNPFRFADRRHLHFRLEELGFGARGTVILYTAVAAAFGLSGLWLQSRGKLYALAILVGLMLVLVAAVNRAARQRAGSTKGL